MTAMITKTSMIDNPLGVSKIRLFPINTCLYQELA
jgi:hypothetical protein